MTGRPPFPLVVAVTLCAIATYTLVPAGLPDIAAEFGVAGAGWVLAAATLPGIVLTPLTGILADRYGRRPVLVACLLAFGAGGGLGALAPSFELLVAARLVQGIGAAGLINLVVTIIADSWDGVERARRMGRNAAALAAAMVALPPVGGVLAAVAGWRLAFVPYWAGLAVAAAVWRWLPEPPRSAAARAGLRPAVEVLAAPGPRNWTGLAALVFLLLFGLVLTVLPAQLATLGLDAGARGLVLALPALTSVLAGLTLGRLTARFDVRRLVVTSFGLWAVAFALVAAVPTVPVIAAGLLLYGLGEGVLIPVLQNAVAAVAPGEIRGTVVAVFVGATRVGQTAGPVLAGPLLDAPQLAFALGALVAAGAAVAQQPARRAAVSVR